MDTIHKSIHVIDLVGNQVRFLEAQNDFDQYVVDLIAYVSNNSSTRAYKFCSDATEVIGSVRALCAHQESPELVQERMGVIATRLLRTEAEVQKRVDPLGTTVRKGSLIQALLRDSDDESYVYLLAKVDHSGWVDDSDYSFKTGFAKDKKAFWKSCVISLPDLSASEYHASVYTDKSAKSWWKDFLELAEMATNEANTSNAFSAVDKALNRTLKDFPSDRTIMRNAFISYFRNNTHIDYPAMIESVLSEDYEPEEMPRERISELKGKLLELPEKKKFDRQFQSVPKAIQARMRRTYQVTDGIELKIIDAVENLRDKVAAGEDLDGQRFIRILTTNDATYSSFRRNSQ